MNKDVGIGVGHERDALTARFAVLLAPRHFMPGFHMPRLMALGLSYSSGDVSLIIVCHRGIELFVKRPRIPLDVPVWESTRTSAPRSGTSHSSQARSFIMRLSQGADVPKSLGLEKSEPLPFA